ncbi:BCCT family transporter, partial [Staphylococcus epidermidis]|uniref:BCCT family transporter n=1 Tax=Staphylococcus epidermidis TaxID=1282 RepID=UPI001642922C
MILPSIILLTLTLIFAITSYTALKKPIQKLTHRNVSLSFLLLPFLFILRPTLFIIQTTVTPFRNMIKHFFHIPTSMEP